MSDDFHGLPCWYELTTPEPLAAADFYHAVIGWEVEAVPMEGFEYFLARQGTAMVAGMVRPMSPEIPPNWLTYFAVRDCDATAAAMLADGAGQIVPPSDIPGTGRFAVLSDPQGAVFGLLQPQPMEEGQGGAYDPAKPGHGAWHELMSGDPAAGLAFYAKHLGWTASTAMPMGELGTYQLFAREGRDIGGMMGLPQPGMPPCWLPYTGVASIDRAKAAVEAGGGRVQHGPMEVPGGAFILQGSDPQGAWFALTGPR